MRAFRLRPFLWGLLSGLWLAGPRVSVAEPLENSETNSTPLKVAVSLEGGPGALPTHDACVTIGTNRFAFVIPEGYRLSTTDSSKLTLVSGDLSSLITWRIVGPVPAEGAELDPSEYRNLVMSRHTGGKIMEEFSAVAGGERGPAFDMRWGGPAGLERRELAVFAKSPWGIVEFDLVSSLDGFGEARQQLNTIMLTFRASDEKGKLVMPGFSDRL